MVDCESFERLNTDRAVSVLPLDAVIASTNPLDQYVPPDAYEDGSLGFIIPSSQVDQNVNIESGGDGTKKRSLVKPLTEDEYILCNSRVRGFALAQKHWGEFTDTPTYRFLKTNPLKPTSQSTT